MIRRVHPLTKDANNRDAVVGDTEINHMPLDIAAPIARSNVITCRSGLRRFGRGLECRSQQVVRLKVNCIYWIPRGVCRLSDSNSRDKVLFRKRL
jgi:hypothetical protein